MTTWKAGLMLAAAAAFAACTSDSSPTCSLAGGTTLAATTWPKFRADAANSGRASVTLAGNTGAGELLFRGYCSIATMVTCKDEFDCQPGETCIPIGPVASTPILDPQNPPNIYLASSDGNVYGVDAQGEMLMALTEQMGVTSAITGTPLLGNDGTLFVPSNSQVTQFDTADGAAIINAPVAGFVGSSVNIWNGDGSTDGTVFVGTNAGIFTGICPNGVARWTATFPATQSTGAVVPDPNSPSTDVTPIIIAAGLNGQVRAYNIRGRQFWSFLAAANIVAAVLVDTTTNLAYVADTSGRMFALNVATGLPDTSFSFAAGAAINASPALGGDRDADPVGTLYVADQNGVLYALDRATGTAEGPPRWTFQADGPISSSPAVATLGTKDVIVFAADILGTVDPASAPVPINGRVYAVRDDGNTATLLWTFDTGHSIGTASPALGIDNRVYISRQGNRRGVAGECPDRDNDGQEDPCVVNDGGALYAIGPTPPATPTPTAAPTSP